MGIKTESLKIHRAKPLALLGGWLTAAQRGIAVVEMTLGINQMQTNRFLPDRTCRPVGWVNLIELNLLGGKLGLMTLKT